MKICKFRVPRGLIQLTLVLPRFFILHHHDFDIYVLSEMSRQLLDVLLWQLTDKPNS